MAFHIGVSGHRHLPGVDLVVLQQAAAALFCAIRTDIVALHAADQANPTPLYRSEPPRLRCLCGMAEGADSILAEAALDAGWELVAVLPFAAEEFAADFSGPALDHFHRLRARAAVTCTLNGDRATATSYADIGTMIVEQSDLLVAVWDRLPARGPGGTAEVVQQMMASGSPVAVLPPSDPASLVWLHGDCASVPELLQAALLPPQSAGDTAQAYFAEAAPRATWSKAAIRAYEGLVTIGAPQPAAEPTPPLAPQGAATALASAFAAADRLAADHAARYRAAGLMRYGLIIPATLASLVAWYGNEWQQAAGNLAGFAILLFIVRFSTRGWWEPSHRRFTAYRALAEYLRSAGLLASLGAVARMPGAAAHQEKAADWTAWYGRALVREQGPASVRFDTDTVAAAAAFVRAEATGQIQFMLHRAARFDVMARRLTQIGVALSICGIAASGVRAAMLLGNASASAMRAFNEMALLLPAMAPVFLGLSSFNEYRKLATRYRAVAAALQVQVAALDRAPRLRPAVLPIARRIADVMLAETADWQLLIKARTVSAY